MEICFMSQLYHGSGLKSGPKQFTASLKALDGKAGLDAALKRKRKRGELR